MAHGPWPFVSLSPLQTTHRLTPKPRAGAGAGGSSARDAYALLRREEEDQLEATSPASCLPSDSSPRLSQPQQLRPSRGRRLARLAPPPAAVGPRARGGAETARCPAGPRVPSQHRPRRAAGARVRQARGRRARARATRVRRNA